MDDARAAELVVALAALAGREIGTVEADAVVALSREMDPQQANEVWTRHRRAPDTVPLREYLAMTLRFVERYPG